MLPERRIALSEMLAMTATIEILLAGILWSFSGVLIKSIALNFISIAGIRSLIGGLIQFLFLVRCNNVSHAPSAIAATATSIFARDRAHWLGAVLFVINMFALALAFQISSATNAVFLHYSGIVLVAALSASILKQPLTKHDWIAIATATAGIGCLCLDGFQVGAWKGTMLGIICGLTLAGSQLCLGLRATDKRTELGALETIVLANVLAASVALIFVLIQGAPGDHGTTQIGMPSVRDCVLLGVLGIVAWGLPDLLYAIGIKKVPVFRALVLGLSDPILTAVWPLILLHEYPTPLGITGAGITLLAVIYQAFYTSKLRQSAS